MAIAKQKWSIGHSRFVFCAKPASDHPLVGTSRSTHHPRPKSQLHFITLPRDLLHPRRRQSPQPSASPCLSRSRTRRTRDATPPFHLAAQNPPAPPFHHHPCCLHASRIASLPPSHLSRLLYLPFAAPRRRRSFARPPRPASAGPLRFFLPDPRSPNTSPNPSHTHLLSLAPAGYPSIIIPIAASPPLSAGLHHHPRRRVASTLGRASLLLSRLPRISLPLTK